MLLQRVTIFIQKVVNMEAFNSFEELKSAKQSEQNVQSSHGVSNIMSVHSSFNELMESQNRDVSDMIQNMSLNMTKIEPDIVVSDARLQVKLNNCFIGCRQREGKEAPHITIEQYFDDWPDTRLLLSTGEEMNPSKVDKDIIKAVQADMLKDPDKYIRSWNKNNPDRALPLRGKQNEQPKKDESWKEEKWYKESQEVLRIYEEDTGKNQSSK